MLCRRPSIRFCLPFSSWLDWVVGLGEGEVTVLSRHLRAHAVSVTDRCDADAGHLVEASPSEASPSEVPRFPPRLPVLFWRKSLRTAQDSGVGSHARPLQVGQCTYIHYRGFFSPGNGHLLSVC